MTNFNQSPEQQPADRPDASLSTFHPAGTSYFYSYPIDQDSGFLNKASTISEELVAARALCIAGADVSVISFASTTNPNIDKDLLDELAIPTSESDQVIVLPDHIDHLLTGKKRHEAIMKALNIAVPERKLAMAQPIVDPEIADLHQIPPEITIHVNDKQNMPEYIDDDLLPTRFPHYESGADFAADLDIAANPDLLPCVVKVSSSSAGDGTYICRTIEEFEQARLDTASIDGTIYIEQYIETVENYAVHFGIPEDKSKPISIIGFNKQLTTDEGEFSGGVIDTREFPPHLDAVKERILHDVLPEIRSKGWYGIGGIDVLIDEDDKGYIIDPNYRVTGMSAYHFMIENEQLTMPLISFSGHFKGSREDFESKVLPHAGKSSPDKSVRLIAISNHDDNWHFNGALMYDDAADLGQKVEKLHDAGVSAPALEQFLNEAQG